jgi:hypothetical protein
VRGAGAHASISHKAKIDNPGQQQDGVRDREEVKGGKIHDEHYDATHGTTAPTTRCPAAGARLVLVRAGLAVAAASRWGL